MQNENIKLPVHVGIIMDGNGRWAQKRGFSRNMGHKRGADVLDKITRYAAKIGIRYLSVYAFSTENWNRPPDEVEGIMDLLRGYLKDTSRFIKENIRIKIIGDRTRLADDIVKQILNLERDSAENTGMTVSIALDYGGRNEILSAAKKLAVSYKKGDTQSLDSVTEDAFSALLYTVGQPEVDLVIRTSGERRISNFLLWQSAYAEFVFSDILWPDFTARDFDDALAEFASRSRRRGGI